MPLVICCSRCGQKLEEPGGLLFDPPDKEDTVVKYHLCRGCWDYAWDVIFDVPGSPVLATGEAVFYRCADDTHPNPDVLPPRTTE